MHDVAEVVDEAGCVALWGSAAEMEAGVEIVSALEWVVSLGPATVDQLTDSGQVVGTLPQQHLSLALPYASMQPPYPVLRVLLVVAFDVGHVSVGA